MPPFILREHARSIWDAAVASVEPRALVRSYLKDAPEDLRRALDRAGRIIVVGGGKAAAAMAMGAVEGLSAYADRVQGVVNTPAGGPAAAGPIRLHAARAVGMNHPTPEGVAGVHEMLELVAGAGPTDVCLCLLSGGGSALLPAPAAGVTLVDKQAVTVLLHGCGASIGEMNCVRKHLSAVKGGRLAAAFLGRESATRSMYSLILSDVVGDPLDVIASGPSVPDPTTFADALAVLERYELTQRAPAAVVDFLIRGVEGKIEETPKSLPAAAHNIVLGNNRRALDAAARRAAELGYQVVDLGSFVEGETRTAAEFVAAVVRSIRRDGRPTAAPVCVLSGGETTVTLPANHGRGGRNQEFVLAAALKLESLGGENVVVLSGGTDGEDGPTDAAGAVADRMTLERARAGGCDPEAALARHDAYAVFEASGDLLKTGLTGTNVMDVRVVIVGG